MSARTPWPRATAESQPTAGRTRTIRGDAWIRARRPSGTASIDVQFWVLYDAVSAVVYGGAVDGGTDLDILDYAPQPGVSVLACGPLDPTCCVNPARGPRDDRRRGPRDARGPRGLHGLLFAPARRFGARALLPRRAAPGRERSVHFPTSMTGNENFAELQSALGIPANTDTGCRPRRRVGHAVRLQRSARQRSHTFASRPLAAEQTIYLQNNFPSRSAKQTAPEGSGVLVNVPSGSVGITSNLATQSNRPLGTANVVVRPGSASRSSTCDPARGSRGSRSSGDGPRARVRGEEPAEALLSDGSPEPEA